MLTCVRDVCGPHDPSDLLHALEVGAETAVAAENLLIHNGGDGQAVEAVRERLPKTDTEPFFALFVKSVDASHITKRKDERK